MTPVGAITSQKEECIYNQYCYLTSHTKLAYVYSSAEED